MTKSLRSPEYEILRKSIAKLRNKGKISQKELASRLKVPPSWVAKVEIGERRLDLVEFCWICQALGLNAPRQASSIVREMIAKRGI